VFTPFHKPPYSYPYDRSVDETTTMAKIINECENAFIKGRYITDGVMLPQEILKETKHKKINMQ
jgi:hypothetical protein